MKPPESFAEGGEWTRTMEPIWSATHVIRPGMVAPLFPLRSAFLFPGQILPLHVFEPRYVQLVEDLLDTHGRMVIGTIREGMFTQTGAPAFLDVAGLGEIARHERLPDGRYGILLVGLARVNAKEVPSERMYRQVQLDPIREAQPSEDEVLRLQQPLIEAIRARIGQEIERADEISTGQLTDLLAQTLEVPQSLMEEIYAEVRVGRRAEKVLAAHEGFPPQAKDD